MTDGRLIDQRFRLGRVVRASEVSVVYEASHRNGRDVWIKLARSREHKTALANEASFANTLGRSAARVLDDGVTEEGLSYLVIEPVSGQRLDQWRKLAGGKAPADEVIGLGDELCQAIETMHRAGFSVGRLRAETIVVLPEGGICLLELEHVVAATPETIAEDVIRVGRVLYEMLAARPSLAQSPPLLEIAPDVTRPVATAIDSGTRGRFTTIDEFRGALRRSTLGPMRAPIQSIAPDRESSESVARPRTDTPVFLEAPSLAPSLQRTKPEPPPPPPRKIAPIIAGALATAFFAASIALAIFTLTPDESDGKPVVAKELGSIVATASASSTPDPIASSEPAPPASIVITSDDVPDGESPIVELGDDEPAKVAVAPNAAERGDEGTDGETTFRFEGDPAPRLVFVDGVAIGATNKDVRTRCGQHTVKIGGKGASRPVDLPCGGEQVIVVETNGTWKEQ